MSMLTDSAASRIVAATHGRSDVSRDPEFEPGLARELTRRCERSEIIALFRRVGQGDEYFDELVRRVCLRALARACGDGLRVRSYVGIRHPETFEIGDGVFIGEHVIVFSMPVTSLLRTMSAGAPVRRCSALNTQEFLSSYQSSPQVSAGTCRGACRHRGQCRAAAWRHRRPGQHRRCGCRRHT